MEFLDTLIGAAVASLAWWAGTRTKRAPKHVEIKAICGCRHHRSFHKDDGPCNRWDSMNERECGCQQYVGPKPYSQVMDEIEGSEH